MIQTKQTLIQRLGTGIVLAVAGLGGLAGLSGCGPTIYEDPYKGWTPEQRQSWMNYMEKDKQKKNNKQKQIWIIFVENRIDLIVNLKL